jgi:ABC-2 type transport system ATP-binding protein
MAGSVHPAVEVVELVKRYPKRDVNAVDGLSFAVAAGEVFGLLGPNGAGKSTTVAILTTRLPATSGQARISGIDVVRNPVEARARLAVVAQRPNLDRSLTPRQNLVFHAAYHGVGRAERTARAAELLDQFGLAEQADVKVDWYSGGMAQRLMIARSLMHEPDVLFLDEPTTGLDPQARLFVWDRVEELRTRGVTILLTTHDMDEAATLCDRVGIVDHGKLLALDTPEALTRQLTGRSVLDLSFVPAPGDELATLADALLELDGVERWEQVAATAAPLPGAIPVPGFPGADTAGSGARRGPTNATGTVAAVAVDPTAAVKMRLYLSVEPAAALGPVVGLLANRGAVLTDVHIGAPSLEDVFINLTGRGLR